MKADDYQELTKATSVYPDAYAVNYCIHGLTNEAGECSGVYKKYLRGDFSYDECRSRMIKELGDVQWYIARLAAEMGYNLSEIMELNLQKLDARKLAGTLTGDGDNR